MGLVLVVVGGYESIVCSCKEEEGYKYEQGVGFWMWIFHVVMGEKGMVDVQEWVRREVNVEGEKQPMTDWKEQEEEYEE